MNKKIILMLAVSFLFLMCLVSSYHYENNGLSLGFKDPSIIKQNQNYTFSIHVYNGTTGQPLGINAVYCAFHLYNSETGNHLVADNNISFGSTAFDFYINIDSGNFSNLGEYVYLFACIGNNNYGSGIFSSKVEVTRSGFQLKTGESVLYAILLIANALIFAFFFYFAIRIPYSNEKNDKGETIRVTKSKYLKLFSIMFAYVSFLWFMTTLTNIGINYLSLEGLKDFILNFYRYTFLFQSWVVRVIFFIIFIEIWRDIIKSKAIKRFGKFIPGKN